MEHTFRYCNPLKTLLIFLTYLKKHVKKMFTILKFRIILILENANILSIEVNGGRKLKLKAVVLILLVAALAALLAAKGIRTNPGSDEYTSNGAVSQSAKLIRQAGQDGKPAWLLFHSKTCQSCIEMEKVFNTLKPEFEGKVTFIDINVNNPAEQDLCAEYKIQYIPTTYILDSAGNNTFDYVGVIQVDDMRAKLKALAVEE